MKQSSIPRTAMVFIATVTAFLLPGNQAAATTAEAESDYPPGASVVDTSNCEIKPGDAWIHDSRDASAIGHDRKQYFRGQDVHFPFKVFYQANTTQNQNRAASVSIVIFDHTSGIEISQGIQPQNPKNTLIPEDTYTGVNDQEFTWTIPPNASFGFYDVMAVVKDAKGNVLDITTAHTTQTVGKEVNNTDPYAETVWIGDDLRFDGNGICTGSGAGGEEAYPLDWTNPLSDSFMVCRDRPVILLHGITSSAQGCWAHMANLLTQRDCRAVVSYDYRHLTTGADNPTTIQQIAAGFKGISFQIPYGSQILCPNSVYSVNWTKSYFNMSKIDVVAHSMGGLAALLYCSNMADTGSECLPFDTDVERLVTMCSPIWGSDYPRLGQRIFNSDAPEVQTRAMYPGSDLLWDLNQATRCSIQHIAIAAGFENNRLNKDECVPEVSACAPGYANASYVTLDNMSVRGTDPHNALPEALNENQLGYRMVSATLLDTPMPLDRVKSFADYNDHTAAVFYRVTNSGGVRVPAKVSSFTSVTQPYPAQQGDFGLGGIQNFWITADNGVNNRFLSPIKNLPVNLVPGTLSMITFVLQPAQDTDHDGLSDDFELRYFESTQSPHDSTTDADSDGFPDYAEQALGTDPTDVNSHFTVKSSTYCPPSIVASPNQSPKNPEYGPPLPGKFNATIDAVPGVTYNLERSDSLENAGWSIVSTLVMSETESGERTLEDAAAPSGRCFYRVGVIVPPPTP